MQMQNEENTGVIPEELIPYRGLLEADKPPMDKKLCEFFITIYGQDEEALQEKREEALQSEDNNTLCINIFDSRIADDVKIEARAWWWIVAQLTRPGDAVMYAYTVSMIGWAHDAPVTIDILTNSTALFAMGVPPLHDESDTTCLAAWDRQKRRDYDYDKGQTDNWLDDSDFWTAQRDYFKEHGEDALRVPEAATT